MEDNKVRADTLIAVLAKYFNIAGQTGIQAAGSDCSQETKKSKEVLREGFKGINSIRFVYNNRQ